MRVNNRRITHMIFGQTNAQMSKHHVRYLELHALDDHVHEGGVFRPQIWDYEVGNALQVLPLVPREDDATLSHLFAV